MAAEMLYLINPRARRGKRKGVSTMAKRRRKSRRTSYRRNPLNLSGFMPMLTKSATGAAGALAVNGIVSNTPIPDSLKTGNMMHLTKAGIALALSVFGPKLPVIGRFARDMALGSLTVTLTDLGKQVAAGQGVNLSGLGYVSPAAMVNRNLPYNAASLGGKFARLGGGGMGQYVRGSNVTAMRRGGGVAGVGQYVRR